MMLCHTRDFLDGGCCHGGEELIHNGFIHKVAHLKMPQVTQKTLKLERELRFENCLIVI